MEAKGVAVRQPGVGDGTRGGSRPYSGTANAWGNEQEPSQAGLVGQAGNTRLSPLSIIGQAGILGARVRKDACLPREICHECPGASHARQIG
jgi:hypothetical protein